MTSKRLISMILVIVTVITNIVLMTSTVSAAISESTFDTKVQEFINDSRWKNGISWVDNKKPVLSTYASIGCCSYAADFVAYVYGSTKNAWKTSDFTKFTDLNEIRKGDIIHLSNHWFVVLDRIGDKLYTAEGNFDDKVRITKDGWAIKNGVIHNLIATSSARVFDCGYHYNFSSNEPTPEPDEFDVKAQSFINDSRWKSGISWGDDQTPKLSTYSSKGDCAYAADFAAYVYGSTKDAWHTSDFTKFTNLNDIRKGDIIHITTHWFVVLDRIGDTFYTAEGNFDDKTRVTKEGWAIKNGAIHNLKASSTARVFDCGYHYTPSEQEPEPETYTITYNANGGSGAPANQTKVQGTDLTLSASKPTRTGYNFLGWATSASATSAQYTAGSVYKNDAAVTLYAVWEKIPVTLSGVSIAAMPSKTTCKLGENLDTSGLTLKLTYSDGSTKNITSGFTTSGFSSDTTGVKKVTVSYSGKTVSFNVTVMPPEKIELVSDSKYTINEKVGAVVVKGSSNGESLESFISNIATASEYIQVVDTDGFVVTSVKRLTTGYTIQLLDDNGDVVEFFTIVMLGDTDRNGRYSMSDVSGVQTKVVNMPAKGTVNFIEADVDGNSRLSVTDASALESFLASGTW